MTGPIEVLALSGGVGGAKLALGLSKILSPEQLLTVVNTADDFEHFGLKISPDLDTLMYTFADMSNKAQGWGLADETWNTMNMLREYEAEDWFQLGDKDIATHLQRTQLMLRGETLTTVTAKLCQQLGVKHNVLPMSDDPVRTVVRSSYGELPFQHYFVRHRCEPEVNEIHFEGIESARPQPRFIKVLNSSELKAVIICPSNPFVSVRPMLALPGVEEALKASNVPVIAVSPIVAGHALKGPTAKMMKELNMPSNAFTVAQYYGDVLDGFVIDNADADQVEAIGELGISVEVAPTIMSTLQDKISLAERCMAFADKLVSMRKIS